jgi:hypothetical protein
MAEYEFVRVKDKTTGHEYSVRFPDPEQHEVLKKDAVDINGDPLPGKPKTTVSKSATAKQEGGQPADTREDEAK